MSKTKEIPSIKIVDGGLIIRISASDLKFVTERKPDAAYSVLDADGFLRAFAKELKNFQHSNATELGITELQYLFDEIIDEVYINGSKYIVDHSED